VWQFSTITYHCCLFPAYHTQRYLTLWMQATCILNQTHCYNFVSICYEAVLWDSNFYGFFVCSLLPYIRDTNSIHLKHSFWNIHCTLVTLKMYCAFKSSVVTTFYSTHISYCITGLDRPVGLQKVEAPRISGPSAHEGGKVVSPTHRPPLPPGDILRNPFC
jgi:hypothetical protein